MLKYGHADAYAYAYEREKMIPVADLPNQRIMRDIKEQGGHDGPIHACRCQLGRRV